MADKKQMAAAQEAAAKEAAAKAVASNPPAAASAAADLQAIKARVRAGLQQRIRAGVRVTNRWADYRVSAAQLAALQADKFIEIKKPEAS